MTVFHGHSLRLPYRLWPLLSMLVTVVSAVTILVFNLIRTSEPTVRFYSCMIPEFVNSASRLERDHTADYLVPNTVHVYLPLSEVAGLSARVEANLLSMYRHQRPDTLMVHTDHPQQVEERIYQSSLGQDPGLREVLRVQHWPTPQHAFGLLFAEEDRKNHISDFVRLRILRQYGGIFVDLSVLLNKDLNSLRKHELVLFTGETTGLDNSVILAHRDSQGLLAWIKSYGHYDPGHRRHHQTPLVNRLLGSLKSVTLVPMEQIYTYRS